MTTTNYRSAGGTSSPNGATNRAPAAPAPRPVLRTGERIPVPPRRRRPGLAALGLLIVFSCAGISGALVLGSNDKTTVLTLARAVPAGHVMTAGDLSTADISGTGLTAIAAASAGTVTGKTAAVDLLPGTLLTSGMLTRARVPGPDQAVVGLALKPGQLPQAELTPGTRVMVIRVPTAAAQQLPVGEANAGSSGSDVLVPEATVLSVDNDQASAGRLVSLVVAKAVAAALARAGATGAVSLAVIASGS
jgi:hypothetical protein